MQIPKGVLIHTERAGYGWYATDSNTYDGPGSVRGWGRTESEAIEDLLDALRTRVEEISEDEE